MDAKSGIFVKMLKFMTTYISGFTAMCKQKKPDCSALYHCVPAKTNVGSARQTDREVP